MQQLFPCPRCGSQNVIGQRFCAGCGESFQYSCARCHGLVDPASRFCTNCGAMLHLYAQQQGQPRTASQHYQQQQGYYTHRQQPVQPKEGSFAYQQWPYTQEVERPKQKRTSPALMGLLSLIAIVFLIGGSLVALREPRPSTQTTPEYTQQQEPTPTTQTSAEDIQEQWPQYPTQTGLEGIKQYENKQPPVMGSYGNTAYIINNSSAKDVSFATLKSFILKDATSEEPYVVGAADCVDFAEEVHNNAEQAGIKAAFVCVLFTDEEIGHTLNAFMTTDRGLVYIDCTGQGLKSINFTTLKGEKISLQDKPDPGQYDKIAYMKKGMQFGAISIDKAESLDYSFYLAYARECENLDAMLDDYNNEVDAFNRALGGRYFLAEPEYSQFKAWEAEINEKKQAILELADKLGAPFEPLGIVEDIEIYW